MMKTKRGMAGLDALPSGILAFAIAFIILGFGAIFITQLRDNVPGYTGTLSQNTSGGYYILNETLKGQAKIGEQGSNIGLIIVIVVIVGLLMGAFGYLMHKRR